MTPAPSRRTLPPHPLVTADLVVYGATAGGLVAAIQARRMGRTAIVPEASNRLGGLSTSGLGNTDSGTEVMPNSPARFTFERSVARSVFAAAGAGGFR
ncbi:FAD-dependent oxidoreductase [Solwaraspora sp. WMMB335]|uniref:FAD-dependent oxidoreductase n=1 Tax=Solwaraspora sp. WMMB335 TaxID=3404118 RepID=UPI003B927CAA